MAHRHLLWVALVSLSSGGLSACTGDLGSVERTEPGAGGSTPRGDGSGNAGAPGAPLSGSNAPDSIELTRLMRLTHKQYENTVSDLLGIPANVSSEFLVDATRSGFDNNVQGLEVAGRLGRDYRRAAEALAGTLTKNDDAYADLVPCDPLEDGCAETFVSHFGRRAFRRPLDSTERERYLDLFEKGEELLGSGDAFRDGVELCIEAFLQSPKFLYRVELSARENADGDIPLDDFELATRLSYLIWNSTPDDRLLEAASSGKLEDESQIAEQAERLLESERAQTVVLDFFAQWLHLAAYQDLTKSGDLGDWNASLASDLQAETLEFVRYVSFEEERGLATLLSAPYTMANSKIAPFYDQEVEGDDFVRLDLDGSRRAGLLTQVGFLASHAYSDASSPIHRGVFVLHQILCEDVPPPPGDVDFTLSEEAKNAPTKRKQVELQTAAPACVNCHSLINPLGFAFEHFDATGRYRDKDGDERVDASGSVELASETLEFDGATDLIEQLAEADATRACYARNWLRYGLARDQIQADEDTILRLADELGSDSFTAGDVLLQIALTPSFRHRTRALQGD